MRLLTLHQEGARHDDPRGDETSPAVHRADVNPAETGCPLVRRLESKCFKRELDLATEHAQRRPSRLPGVAGTGVAAVVLSTLKRQTSLSACCVSVRVKTGNRKTVCGGGDFLSPLTDATSLISGLIRSDGGSSLYPTLVSRNTRGIMSSIFIRQSSQ